MNLSLAGVWGVTSVRGDQAPVVRIQLTDPTLSGGTGAVASTVWLEALRHPFFVTFDEGGAARQLWLDPGVGVEQRDLLRYLVSILQIAGRSGDAREWTTTERDLTGPYEARYHRRGDGSIAKQKVAYRLPSAASGGAPARPVVEVLSSAWEARFGRGGALSRFAGSEEVSTDGPVGDLKMVAHTELSADLIASDPEAETPSELIGSFERERSRLRSWSLERDPSELAAISRVHDEQLVEGASLSVLVDGLRAVADNEEARRRAQRRLEALFRLDPRAPEAAAALVRQSNGQAPAIVSAMAAAGTLESQRALRSLVTDSAVPRPLRLTAVQMIGQLAEPTREAIDGLEPLLDVADPELRQAGAYAYGATLRAGAAREPERVRQGLDALTTRLERARTADEKIDLLDSLGNAGNPAALPIIRRSLEDADPEVRAVALKALRLIPDPAADELLSATIVGADVVPVRIAALFAAGFRPVEPYVAPVGALLAREPTPRVRESAVHLLGPHVRASKAIAAVMKHVAEEDGIPSVRDAAARYLADH